MHLTANNLTTRRGGRIIFKDLSFTLASGEALVLTGPNGSGKTTLIRAIAGYIPLAAGSLALQGGTTDIPIAEQCHYIGHKNAIKSNLSVEENLRFWADFLAVTPDSHGQLPFQPQKTSVEDAMDEFNLTALRHIPGGYLSAGQTRRLGLARLLVAPRPLWLLDEPTVSLDTASQNILSATVNAHVEEGGLAIAATHIPLGLRTTRKLQLGEQPDSAVDSL